MEEIWEQILTVCLYHIPALSFSLLLSFPTVKVSVFTLLSNDGNAIGVTDFRIIAI